MNVNNEIYFKKLIKFKWEVIFVKLVKSIRNGNSYVY